MKSISIDKIFHPQISDFIPENQSMMKADNEMSDGNYVSYTTHSDAWKILPN